MLLAIVGLEQRELVTMCLISDAISTVLDLAIISSANARVRHIQQAKGNFRNRFLVISVVNYISCNFGKYYRVNR